MARSPHLPPCHVLAHQAQLGDPAAGSPALLCLSAASADRAVEHGGGVLEVVQQGEWYGLRSPLLEGLFLQARKKAPHLVFFSARLGVWEQWKVDSLYQGVMQQHSPALCLGSRQVPTVALSVRAWRVGSVLGPALPRPASPPRPVQRGAGPVQVHQADPWRQALTMGGDTGAGGEYAESLDSSLQDDALELSHNVVKGYVTRVTKWPLYLAFRMWRALARSEHQKRDQATAHRERRLQSAAWAAMQQLAATERHERHLMACQRKDRWRRCAAVLAAWARLTGERRVLVHRYMKSRQRVAVLLARSILLDWQAMAAERRWP
ncbi:hypothetical protein GPECTOR_56g411 [Gonium pectorale]|uniref:Uncharacterized protein n=1 Tax=Gonium pectorale TaxID=33097 RepID=A0A150G666_GONPE|nr:hypothetical protein GPECTOR_56g411 [Gonium pectorale]|eukprot:KXZ45314.1 hypothetical protein GPECTOR_56g411 [Gonium pectorale]